MIWRFIVSTTVWVVSGLGIFVLNQRIVSPTPGAGSKSCLVELDVGWRQKGKIWQHTLLMIARFENSNANIALCMEFTRQLWAHWEECPDFPITCPNKCNSSEMKRKQLIFHTQRCPEQVVACQFKDIGCSVFIKRKDEESHMSSSMADHMMLLLKENRELRRLSYHTTRWNSFPAYTDKCTKSEQESKKVSVRRAVWQFLGVETDPCYSYK